MPVDQRADVVGVSEFQTPILADGVVSRAEYEQAYDAAVSCMREAGLVVEGPLPMNAGRYLSYVVRLGGENPTQAGSASTTPEEAAVETCEAEYLSEVSSVWSAQQAPEGSEAEEVRRSYVECLQDRGLAVDDAATVESFETDPLISGDPRARPCIEQYSTSIRIFDDTP